MNVVFVNMPFASLRPAIGVSLLKGHLQRMGIASHVFYLNLRFAERLDPEWYRYVADRAPAQILLGEWIFSPCVFPRLADNHEAYLGMVENRFPSVFEPQDIREQRIRQLMQARREAERFLNECVELLDWSAYDVVGFTTSFNQNLASLALAERLKARYPHLCIVFGGANCEGEMGLQLHRSFPCVDFVCSGEADVSFPALVACLQEGKSPHGIPGVISRRDSVSYYSSLQPERVDDLDALPYPDYNDYFEQWRPRFSSSSLAWVLMETSRGCWWGEQSHCTFCGLNGLSMRYRAKSPQRALDEIIALTGRYGTPHLEMVDNILDMQYFRDLLPELKERGIALSVFYETKANLRKDQIGLLREAGVSAIQPGIESFSTHVLRLMRKGTTAIQNIQLLKWCKEFGVTCNWNLLFGFPGEELADYEHMLLLLDSLHHLDPPLGWGPVRLDRFSPYFVAPEQFGVHAIQPDRSYSYIYDLPADALQNLAYYFEHKVTGGLDPETYVPKLSAAVLRWIENASKGGLLYVDDGTALTLQDFRVGAARLTTVLTGWEREIYRYCDQNRSPQQLLGCLRELGASNANLEEFLQRMLELRLMVAADGRYLALAIPARVVRDDAPEDIMSGDDLQALREKLHAWSQTMSDKQRAYLEGLVGTDLLTLQSGSG